MSNDSRFAVKVINPGEDYSETMKVRYPVFVEEQGVPLENEADEYDKSAYHIVFSDLLNGVPVACGRIYFLGNSAKLGRVAVLKEYRRKGLATEICSKLIALAVSHKAENVIIHAQTYIAGLYEKIGFIREGGEFSEENIPHVKMTLKI
jgi:predicted GNAT family N-acyltransferase